MRTQKRIDVVLKETIALFINADRKLIPLKQIRLDLPTDNPWNKRPLYNNWTTRQHTKKQIEHFAKRKHNIGWCLGPKDLIIDVDARNNGIEGFKLLQADYPQINFSFFPSVSTGGGGYHIYATIPSEIDGARIRKGLPKYPGIDFLSNNRQILIPGCIHPTGKSYEWIADSPFNDQPPEIPLKLSRQLVYKNPSQTSQQSRQHPSTLHTLSELAELLSKLPVEEYDDNDSWFSLMASAHHCTAGEGIEEFLEWSLDDPEYQDDEQVIRSRWESLGRNEIDPRTVRTIYREVQKHNGELPNFTTALQDFEDDFDNGNNANCFDDLFGFDDAADTTSNLPDTKGSNKADESNKISLDRYIGKLTKETPIERINKAIAQVGKLSAGNQDRYIKKIARRSGIRSETIRRQIRSEQEKAQSDIEQRIADRLLKEKYSDGEHLIYTINQRFRVFNGTHWSIKPKHLLEKHIENIAEEVRDKDKDLEFNIARIFAGVDRIARGRVMVEEDLFSMKDGPPPILNLANGELHFDAHGNSKLKRHNYKSYLPWCLDHIKHNSKAKCTLYDNTLLEIFSKADEPKEIIRHMWEMLGYAIQSEKNLPIWCMFYGHGADGKSTIIRIWAAMLGPAAISQSLSSLDIRKNKHAYSELPGKLLQYDADLADGVYLPEAYLKNVSENGWLLADPKGMTPYNFRACITSIAATNYLPPIRNLSKGVARRAMLIPFNRSFKQEEQDINRADRIIQSELSGVLNKALQGLKRLRKRGYFSEPSECKQLKNTWMEHSSNILAFLNEVQPIRKDSWRKRKMNAKKLYEQLNDWYNEEEIEGRNRVSYRGMVKKLRDMGFIIKRGSSGLTSVEVRR